MNLSNSEKQNAAREISVRSRACSAQFSLILLQVFFCLAFQRSEGQEEEIWRSNVLAFVECII